MTLGNSWRRWVLVAGSLPAAIGVPGPWQLTLGTRAPLRLPRLRPWGDLEAGLGFVVAWDKKAGFIGKKALARFVAFSVKGVAPEVMGIGPVAAIPAALKLAGLSLADIGLIELNEAFAAQSLAVLTGWGLEVDDARVNPDGGAIALGHPLGATGAKLTATLLHHLRRTDGRYGVVSMCIGGGMGAAAVFERA